MTILGQPTLSDFDSTVGIVKKIGLVEKTPRKKNVVSLQLTKPVLEDVPNDTNPVQFKNESSPALILFQNIFFVNNAPSDNKFQDCFLPTTKAGGIRIARKTENNISLRF